VSVERYVDAGEVDVVRGQRLAAVALWRRPSTSLAGAPDLLPTAGGLLRALIGAARAVRDAAGPHRTGEWRMRTVDGER
jgi:hypothetical protein